jgi:hypothetical protein
MRSAEQQALFEKFEKALQKYKGKTVGTIELAELVKKIYGKSLGDRTASKKLGDLRLNNPEIFKDIDVEYSIKGQGDWNKAWENDPEFRKFFKQKRPGLVWEDLTTAQRDIKQNTYKSYLYEQGKSKAIPKNYIPFSELLNKLNVKKDSFREYESNRKGNYGDLQNKIKKLFDKKSFKKEIFYKDPSKKDISEFNTAVSKMQKQGIQRMSEKKSAGSTEPLKAIHRELMLDPDARPTELAEAIYGKADSKTLRDIGNDASKYTEFLTGSRQVSGLKMPSVQKTEDILGNILMPGSGFFNFGNNERRNAMLRERDKVLGITDINNRLFSTRNRLVKTLRGQGFNIDEAMGLAATYERAPGYSELAQLTKPEVNYLKGNTIDKDFSRIFDKVIKGKENIGEEIKQFNKDSKLFQKQYGIDTPIIEYKPGEKLDASKFVKNFDKLTPEARANVTELADRGIALRSKAMPMGALLAAVEKAPQACRTILNYQTGGISSTCAEAIQRDPVGAAEKLKNLDAQSGPLAKVKNAATSFLKSGGFKTFGAGAAVGTAIGLVKAFRNDDPTTYLSNEDQQKSMLVDMATQPISIDMERPAILDYQLPALGATLAGTTALGAPSTIKASKSRALGIERKPKGFVKTGARVLGRGLGIAASPALLAPFMAGDIASQVAEGDSITDIATDPLNYTYPIFAEQTDKLTRGLNPTFRKFAKLGLGKTALKGLSRAGIGGLAASLAIQGVGLLDD